MKQKQTTPAEETEDKRPNETPDGDSSDAESSDGESSDGLKEAGESMLSHLIFAFDGAAQSAAHIRRGGADRLRPRLLSGD